jgi:hypothetical protein
MPEIGMSGLMSGDRKRSVAIRPKPPRLSSTLHGPAGGHHWRASSSCLTSAARGGGTGAASESYWSLNDFPIA